MHAHTHFRRGKEMTAMVMEWVSGGTLQQLLEADSKRYRTEMLRMGNGKKGVRVEESPPAPSHGKKFTTRLTWENPLLGISVGTAR